MKCPHCQEEIGDTGFAYCPRCGKKLKPTEKRLPAQRISARGRLSDYALWILVFIGLIALLFFIDTFDGTRRQISGYPVLPSTPVRYSPYTWAPQASLYISGLAVVTYLLISLVKRRQWVWRVLTGSIAILKPAPKIESIMFVIIGIAALAFVGLVIYCLITAF